MKVERISKFKSAVLAFTMLTFAVVMVLEGVAVGDTQTNNEQPILEISKTMTSGETTVPIKTKEYWTLEIAVSNNDPADLTSVVVSDTIPGEITLDGTAATKGLVTTTTKSGATKLTWAVGTITTGATETLTMSVSTKTEGTGRRRTQYFLEAGEYVLNEGASASGTSQAGTITAGPTDPITVYAYKPMGGRMGMGGGMGGGRWR